MVSEKMKAFTQNSSAIRAMFEEGKKMAQIYGPENVYDFSLGNPSIEPPPQVRQALIRILETQSQNFVHGYTNNSGYEDVRAYVADSTNREFGTQYTQDNVIMTNGAAGGLNIILKCVLNPGDEVIVFAPFFGEYNAYVQNYDGKVVVVKPNTNTFQVDLEAFEQAFTENTKAVIINSPNNPTGVVYGEDTIRGIAAVLEKKQAQLKKAIYLITDEPYRRLVYDGVTVPFVPNYYKNTFFAYSFSKSLSLPGERIGYVIANTEMDSFEQMMYALNVANRICGFVNAPSLFQRIIPDCMDLKTDVSAYDNNRKKIISILEELGYSFIRPQGAFYIFPQSLIEDDVAFCQAAKEFRLLLVPGSSFGCPGHFRLSYCVSEKTIEDSFDSFQKLAQKYQR